MTNVKGSTVAANRNSGTTCPLPAPKLICSSRCRRCPSARCPCRRASRSNVARGSFTPVKRSITALAWPTGSLLTAKAAISWTPGRTTPRLGQAQEMIRRKTPAFATATPPPLPPQRDPSKASLVAALVSRCQPTQLPATDRADRRCLIGLFLRRFFQQHSLQLVGPLENLLLQVPHRLIAGFDAPA